MAIEAERLLAIFEARFSSLDRALEKSRSGAIKAFGDIEKAGTGAEALLSRIGSRGTPGVDRLNQSLTRTRFETSNVAAQFQDIAVQLAGGQSPFLIALQQGTQLSQTLGPSGLRGSVALLGGAFTSMLNPVSLATLAIIGLGGSAVQYFSGVREGTKDTNDLLQRHADVVRSFDAAYGIAAEGVKRYTEAAKAIELQKLRDEFGNLEEAARSAADGISEQIRGVAVAEFEGATKSIDDFSRALGLVETEKPDFAAFAIQMAEIENSQAPDTVRSLARELRLTAQGFLPYQQAIDDTDAKLRAVQLSGDQAKEMFAALTAAALGFGGQAGSAIEGIVDKFRSDLLPAMEASLKQLGTFIANYQSLQKMVEQTPLGTLSPLVSGGGSFLNPDQYNTFRANQASLADAGGSASARLIRRFEGFRTNAYWDVNHYRTGYGSDTTTRANGSIERVTRATVVTLDDAERDLSRRILEFQDGIRTAIGSDAWRALSENQQAALTSVAYNYGSLPGSIIKSLRSGQGAEATAKAIAALPSNNSRRREEAQSFLSGTGVSMNDAGLGRGRAARTPDDMFRGSVEQVEQRIAAINAEMEAQRGLTSSIDDYGYAVEKARLKQQLLNDAKRAGVTVTPELTAQIDQLAENYARASSSADQLAASQQAAAQTAAEFSDIGREALGGFIRDLIAGKSASEALANALSGVADRLLDMALDSLFSPKAGGGLFGGLFGALFGGKGFASGTANTGGARGEPRGVVHGQEAVIPLTGGRKVPVDLGGAVLTGRGGGRELIEIRLHDDSGRMAQIADQRIRTASGPIIQVAVKSSVRSVRSGMPGLMAEAQRDRG